MRASIRIIQNNGNAVINALSSYISIAPVFVSISVTYSAAGFAGTFCQVNIDECESRNGRDLCGERGTCLDLIDGFSCLCAPGYQGKVDDWRK